MGRSGSNGISNEPSSAILTTIQENFSNSSDNAR
jgi:hypothetical protein